MKKNKLIYKTIIILLLGILLTACWDKAPKYIYLNQEVKDYCIFEKGSYWIYQDSVTNSTDSVVLLQSLLEEIETEGNIRGIEILEFYSSENCHYLSDTSIFLSSKLDPWSCGLSAIAYNSGIQDLEKNIILYPRSCGGDYLHSYNIGENDFSNVKIVWEKHPIRYPDAYYTTDYYIQSYWAKNIGIIRYEIYSPDKEILNTYNLIKYSVKPYKK